MLGHTANVRSDGRSFPCNNADVCATDRQRRRRYSAADQTTRQSDVASDRAHLTFVREKKLKIILRRDRDSSKDLSFK